MSKLQKQKGGKKNKTGRKIVFIIALSGVLMWLNMYDKIPERIRIPADQATEKIILKQLPWWIFQSEKNRKSSSFSIECTALGIIPVKNVEASVVKREKVRPCGLAAGIYLKTQGVLIVGTDEVRDINGAMKRMQGDIIRSGDYILAVNQVPVSEKEEVIKQMNRAVDQSVVLTVLRDNTIINLKVPVIQTGEKEYKAGIWIRDDTQGIGTLTYVDENGNFGALGHGISDIDTSTLLTLEEGRLYQTEIRSIVRGLNGAPGEVRGVIHYTQDNMIGVITKNTKIGIFGSMQKLPEELCDEMEIAYKQEIECEKAELISSVSGTLEHYEIEIEKTNLNSRDANKSMIIKITDPRLLELTGGIIQGMSGSPIIQEHKFVGAVTHVFVNDPQKGYAIFAETMLEEQKK